MGVGGAGEQLSGAILYEQQRRYRLGATSHIAPLVVADRLQVPENIGGLLRVADAAGCERVILLNDEHHPLSNRFRKTARHCEMLIPWSTMTYETFLTSMDDLPPLIAIELTTHSRSLFEAWLPDTCGFVVGNERHGISREVLLQCHEAIHIPMYGVNGSMNVVHALAIVLFEWHRQQTVRYPS